MRRERGVEIKAYGAARAAQMTKVSSFVTSCARMDIADIVAVDGLSRSRRYARDGLPPTDINRPIADASLGGRPPSVRLWS
jgi:hypothetical protein